MEKCLYRKFPNINTADERKPTTKLKILISRKALGLPISR